MKLGANSRTLNSNPKALDRKFNQTESILKEGVRPIRLRPRVALLERGDGGIETDPCPPELGVLVFVLSLSSDVFWNQDSWGYGLGVQKTRFGRSRDQIN